MARISPAIAAIADADIYGRAIRAESQLKSLSAWIRHWQADAAAGLAPTPDSLSQMQDEIAEVLAKGKAAEVRRDAFAAEIRASIDRLPPVTQAARAAIAAD